MRFLLIALISAGVQAKSLSPVAGKQDHDAAPEYQSILAKIKSFGEFVERPAITTTVNENRPRPMSKGEQMVAEAKARNRAVLAGMKESEKQTPKDDPTKSVHQKWREEVQRTHEGWKKEIQDTRKQWQREQDIYLGRIKEYQSSTFEIPVKQEKIVEMEVPKERLPSVHVISTAFSIPIRDQRGRPTCAAFAGLRAVEIILAQHQERQDLSTQYFYWASKPKCQQSPCTEKGSWVTPGFRFSQTFRDFDIPLETNCPYQVESMAGNETHVPLRSTCNSGMVKVQGYEEVRTLADTVENLKQNIPVIMAAKLTWNFYRNEGLVSIADSLKPAPGKMDYHSMGHAFLAVGLMELPEKIQKEEGNYCILIANSWGKGWGTGGYSCLTEKWLQKHRQSAPFAAVTKVGLR